MEGISANIKQRRQSLVYKPLIKEEKGYFGFAKKVELTASSFDRDLPGIPALSEQNLLHLTASCQTVDIKKIAFVWKFNTQPKIKLELSRLSIKDTIFFSVCIEGRSLHLVQEISYCLLRCRPTENYIQFLKKRNV